MPINNQSRSAALAAAATVIDERDGDFVRSLRKSVGRRQPERARPFLTFLHEVLAKRPHTR